MNLRNRIKRVEDGRGKPGCKCNQKTVCVRPGQPIPGRCPRCKGYPKLIIGVDDRLVLGQVLFTQEMLHVHTRWYQAGGSTLTDEQLQFIADCKPGEMPTFAEITAAG